MKKLQGINNSRRLNIKDEKKPEKTWKMKKNS